MEEVNLWEEVGNECLQKALSLLQKEIFPTAGTVETVKNLVETAISIDMLNLQWTNKSQSGAVVFAGQLSGQKAKEN